MVYYVEDDRAIRELVIYSLKQSGMDARGFESGKEFFEMCGEELPDFVLLDIMLPGEDGISILNKLKSGVRTKSIPVIMLTAKSAEYDKVQGLDMGADDYIAKPFGVMELLSRIRAVQRRIDAASGKNLVELVSGALALNTAKHTVTAAGEPITLTYKEYELLRFMMENKGMAFDRERLLEAVWGYDYFGGTRTVDVHIQTLRQKLGECAARVQTVRGIGYRLEE